MSKSKGKGQRKGKGIPKRKGKSKGNGMRETSSKRFVPPSSGQLLRVLVDALKLRQTERLQSSRVRDYLGGDRLKPETLTAVFNDLVEVFSAAGLLPPNAPLPPKGQLDKLVATEAQRAEVRRGITSRLRECAESWDRLVDEFKSGAPHVPDGPQLGLAFARLAVIDVALRLASFRSYHQLGPLEDLLETSTQGCWYAGCSMPRT